MELLVLLACAGGELRLARFVEMLAPQHDAALEWLIRAEVLVDQGWTRYAAGSDVIAALAGEARALEAAAARAEAALRAGGDVDAIERLIAGSDRRPAGTAIEAASSRLLAPPRPKPELVRLAYEALVADCAAGWELFAAYRLADEETTMSELASRRGVSRARVGELIAGADATLERHVLANRLNPIRRLVAERAGARIGSAQAAELLPLLGYCAARLGAPAPEW